MASFPARVRALPNTDADILARLPETAVVLLGGVTEDGAWALIKVVDERLEEDGLEGWIAQDLLTLFGDASILPLFGLDGLPLNPPVVETPTQIAETPTETPESEATPTPSPVAEATRPSEDATPTPLPEAEQTPENQSPLPTPPSTPTSTPSPTPTAQEDTSPLSTPTVEAPTPTRPLPAPAQDELILTVQGDAIPANPLDLIPTLAEDGTVYALDFDPARSDEVEIWSGALGLDDGRWLPARPELLWPGTQVYVRGEPSADDPMIIIVDRVRIVAPPPDWQRLRLFTVPRYATAIARDEALSLLTLRNDPGIWLLETDDDFTAIWDSGQGIVAIEGENGGAVIPSSNIAAGISSFVYNRNDGLMVEVTAQPFYSLAGVSGDGEGNLWWIEVSQVAPAQWQLWYFHNATRSLTLAAQPPLAIFANDEGALLQPSLVDVRLNQDGLSLLVETSDPASARLYTGLYRVALTGSEVTTVTQLLAAGTYRSPLRVNPSGTRLAYFVYDSTLESLTAGFIQPPNRIFVLPLDADDTTPIPIYQVETRFEFLAPNLSWRGDDTLILARSRFSPEGVFALERFGIVAVQIADNGSVGEVTYLLPAGTLMDDFAVCQDGNVMLSISGTPLTDAVDAPESTEDAVPGSTLAVWPVDQDPQSFAMLEADVLRIQACWLAPSITDSITE
ncbi:MAG: hypothetical protein R2856_00350 [Caldilineaceae bacterium]